MANDDRNRPRAPAAPPLEPIKVRQLTAKGPDTVLPKPARSGTLHAGARPTGEVITIRYEPWQRHHRVIETENGKVKNEVCIPESWVAYTPEDVA